MLVVGIKALAGYSISVVTVLPQWGRLMKGTIMKRFSWFPVGLLAVGLFIAGCDSKTPSKPAETPKGKEEAKDDHDDHDHGPGPHGGTILEFGKYHGEFCMDHGKKQATVYILSGNLKKSVPLKVDKLTLTIKKPSFVVDLLPSPQESDPKGECSRFVATHNNFGVEQEFEGSVNAMIDGKPFAGDFKEKPHEHEPKKK